MRSRILYFILTLIFVSCKNDIDVIRNLTKNIDLPDITGDNIEIIYTDSLTIRMKLTAPKIIRFDRVKEPYYEFPNGMHVYSYDSHKKVISDISSEYALYNQVTHIWHVKKNVIAHNFIKNEQINTEELYWNEATRTVYTDKFVRITNNSGVFFGEKGFESDENMSRWKLIGSKGTLNIKEKK